ncbi:unnamed protein product [Protopolystoma xenopodis]|uniref:Uncharacterized protein n=1 Tax=Protopolystoma xenopodis TaxID=117903 RepID=A0A3S5CH17_9PLAT|nr:unnamed protein product [Protopolystoma xenopodis]
MPYLVLPPGMTSEQVATEEAGTRECFKTRKDLEQKEQNRSHFPNVIVADVENNKEEDNAILRQKDIDHLFDVDIDSSDDEDEDEEGRDCNQEMNTGKQSGDKMKIATVSST